MTLVELRNAVRDHLVFNSTKLPDATVDLFVGLTFDEMLNAHDWTLPQSTTMAFTYGAATDGVNLPAGFVRDDGVYQINNTAAPDGRRTWTPRLDGGRPAWVTLSRNTGESDTEFIPPAPSTTYYFLHGPKVYIVPNPTGTQDYEMDYLQSLTALSDTNPFLVMYPWTVLEGALREAYLWNHEDERAGIHEARFQRLVDGAKKRDTGSRMAGVGKRER